MANHFNGIMRLIPIFIFFIKVTKIYRINKIQKIMDGLL